LKPQQRSSMDIWPRWRSPHTRP